MTPPSIVTITKRIKNALRGAFIADSASLGTHWIYNPKDMLDAVPTVEKPEFKDPPTPNFYSSKEFPNHYDKVGTLSPYGEQLLFVIEYLVNKYGNGRGSSLPTPPPKIDGEDMSEEFVKFINTFGGRPDHAMKEVVENRSNKDDEKKKMNKFPDSGADDSQAHCFVKSVPVTCLFVGLLSSSSSTSTTTSGSVLNNISNLLIKENVETAIRIHQNNDIAVSYGHASSTILQSLLLSEEDNSDDNDGISFSSLEHAIEQIANDDNDDNVNKPKESLQRVKDSLTQNSNINSFEEFILDVSHELMKEQGKGPESPFYDLAGRSCNLPGSFLLPMYILLSGCDGGDQKKQQVLTYESAIRQNILGSGDTCGRSIFLGAVMGIVSKGGVPQSFIDKMDKDTMKRIDIVIDKLIQIIISKSNTSNSDEKNSGGKRSQPSEVSEGNDDDADTTTEENVVTKKQKQQDDNDEL